MTRRLDIALTLMRMALALLDAEGEGLAACRLQHAIDSVGEDKETGWPQARAGELGRGW